MMFMFVLWVPVENHCCDVYVCSLGSCGDVYIYIYIYILLMKKELGCN